MKTIEESKMKDTNLHESQKQFLRQQKATVTIEAIQNSEQNSVDEIGVIKTDIPSENHAIIKDSREKQFCILGSFTGGC